LNRVEEKLNTQLRKKGEAQNATQERDQEIEELQNLFYSHLKNCPRWQIAVPGGFTHRGAFLKFRPANLAAARAGSNKNGHSQPGRYLIHLTDNCQRSSLNKVTGS